MTLSSLFGFDVERLEWQSLGSCSGISVPELFFSEYETDPDTARAVDALCLSCPVQSICLQDGISHKETGVWGGVYLESGIVSGAKNNHKSESVWNKLSESL